MRLKMKIRKISFVFLSVLMSALAALSGFMIYREMSARQKEKEDFAELAELVRFTPSESSRPDEEPPLTDIKPESVHKRDLMPLFAQNSDCIGWLCIPDTEINYPVMHTPEIPQKYLRINFYGEYSQSGTPFLDGRCDTGNGNLIVYGHNMRGGAMFGTLAKYIEKAYMQNHPVIEWETEASCSEYNVFAAVIVDKYDDWYGFIDSADNEEFEKQIKSIQSKALYCTEAVPEYGKRLLTLSTCYDLTNDSRLLIIAVKT